MCLERVAGYRLRHSPAQNPLVIACSSPWLTVPITHPCSTPHLHIPQGWAKTSQPSLRWPRHSVGTAQRAFAELQPRGWFLESSYPHLFSPHCRAIPVGQRQGHSVVSHPSPLLSLTTWFPAFCIPLKPPSWRSVLCNSETVGWLPSIWIKWMMQGVVFSFPRKWKWDPLFHSSSSTEVRCHQQDYWAFTISKRWFLGGNAELALTKDSVFT